MTKANAARGLFVLLGALALGGSATARAATGTLGTGSLVPLAPGERTAFAPPGTLLTGPAAKATSEQGKGKESKSGQDSSGTEPSTKAGGAPSEAGSK